MKKLSTKNLKWFSSILTKITDEIVEKTGCDIDAAIPLAEVELWKKFGEIVDSSVKIYKSWEIEAQK